VIEVRLSVDGLGRKRFGYSPLAEVACSIRLLGVQAPGYVMRPWQQEVAPLVAGMDLDLLRAVAPPGRWAPDFLFTWSSDPKVTVEQQLELLAARPRDQLCADLREVWSDRPAPHAAVRLLNDEPGTWRRLADDIWDYWQLAIAPHWTRIRSVVEDDVSYRASHVLAGGLFDLLSDLHPEVALRDRALFIDKPHHADATIDDAELTLIPSVFVWPDLVIAHGTPGPFELHYSARGVGRVWEGLSTIQAADRPLAALLGRTRAAVLRKRAWVAGHLRSFGDECRILTPAWPERRRFDLDRKFPLVAATRVASKTAEHKGARRTSVIALPPHRPATAVNPPPRRNVLIGVLGGMSWQSTIEYYRILNAETARRRGGLRSAELLMRSVDFQPMADLQAAGEWARIGRLLAEEGARLTQAGAQVLLLATNTMHRAFDPLARAVSVPVIHIVDPTARALAGAGRQRPILLGTIHTMRASFWPQRLRTLTGIDAVVPDDEGMRLVNSVIYDELCKGIIDDRSRRNIVTLVDTLAERDGADSVILGCTELTLLLGDTDLGVPLFDTTRLHAVAAIDLAEQLQNPRSRSTG